MVNSSSSGNGSRAGKGYGTGSYNFGKGSYGPAKSYGKVSTAYYIPYFSRAYKVDTTSRFYNSRQYRNLLQTLLKELYVTPTLRRYNRTELEERTKKYRKICPLCGSELLSPVCGCGFRYGLN